MQSAYRRGCSCETALLKVTNDIYEAFDKKQTVVLAALDQSAAFDCIEHDTLLHRLNNMFGINNKALDWFQSYLDGRSTRVKFEQYLSNITPLTVGVPQGSSLGPTLFTLFIAPLSTVIEQFGINHHQYADDTQVYIAADANEFGCQTSRLEECLKAVHIWLTNNGLSLNPAKTEVVQFSSSRSIPNNSLTSLTVSDAVIVPATSVKNLGVTLDNHLTFNQHVNNVSKSCYFHIRALRHVRDSLPDDVARMVASSIVTSRLDYCNALFVSMSAANFNKLQRVQNSLARVVLRLPKHSRITTSLHDLHWLPVRQRVIFKLAVVTYKAVRLQQPPYLSNLVNFYVPARNLRSTSQQLLTVARSRTVTAGKAFRHSAPAVWNSLPYDIRNCDSLSTFRRSLKTYLFSAA